MKNNKFFLGIAIAALVLTTACDNDDDQPLSPELGVTIEKETFEESDGTITISFTTPAAFSTDVVINYEVSGTAAAGEDYDEFPGSITLLQGETSITQIIQLIDDDVVEQAETIIFTITTDVAGNTDPIASNTTLTLTINDNDAFPFENGILVLHEGNFFGGNASVSFVSEDLGTIENGIFTTVNDRALGDTAQSMAFNGDLAYIVVNNSQTVEVVNRYTLETVATVDSGLLNPRYMAFANGKGYVTNWGDGGDRGDDYIAVIDLETYTVASTISVPEGPEWILANGNTLYVAHQGGFNQNNIVSVIDAMSDTTADPIVVGDSPNSMQLVNNELWVLSGGKPAFTQAETAGQLDRIDITTNTVTATLPFPEITDHPNYLSIDGNQLYYALKGAVFQIATTATEIPSTALISDISFYDMTVNDGRLYGVDAKDFVSNGSLEVYDIASSSLLESLEISIIPGAVYFNDSFSF
ncbi:MAG: DUF5074 domain-containing protein [Bacteroidota bacterium]